tara:strand:- start:409 stop:1197 length:789 start_codon:yes stop_codon:yes gene_type:complete
MFQRIFKTITKYFESGKFLAVISPLILIFLLLIIWEIGILVFNTPNWMLPSPLAIIQEIIGSKNILLEHALVTLNESFWGLLLAIILGVIFGIVIFSFKIAERSVYPLIIASQTIPIIAIAPLLLIWVGPGIQSKIIVVVLISFFPVVVNLIDGFKNSDKDYENMLKTFNASKIQILLKIHFPFALPYLLSGIKIASVSSIIGAVIGEWVGSTEGLGWLIKISSPQFLTERMFASIVILSFMAIILFLISWLLEKFLLRNYQ